ncbi:CAMK family protein kinase [Histomonas meleagridis]|uniref:CAMK family protein kinase n=1 Tax=Histomonas meleagridis TaxID=135588 RepID=UPI00355A018A|nr:CAMK family protein kinase [Histomonas meleagridis]KAH0797086.1 CAMK family protein kinase [Histomonas meleagridis]
MLLKPVPQLSLSEIQQLLPEHRYHFVKAIGMGGYGSVFLVKSDKYNQYFCIKRIKQIDPKNDNTENEASTLIMLCHPNIISMYEYFFDQTKTNLYIVLEYCSGGSLKDLIEREGPIRPPKLYSYCYQILNALLHCHEQNIAHRDIKPANILIDKYNRPKLADFGLSRRLEKGENLQSFAGSRPFMAPEIISRENADPFLADIWSLGVTFFTLAFGRLPWGVSNGAELDAAIKLGIITFPTFADQEFCNLISSMVVVKPSKRKPIAQLMKLPLFAEYRKPFFPSSIQARSRMNLDTGDSALFQRSKSTVQTSLSHNRIIASHNRIRSYMSGQKIERPIPSKKAILHKTFGI